MRGLYALLALSLSCGGGSLKSNGEQCVSSSECAAGLICDTTQTPHVCAGTSLVDAPEFKDAPPVVVDGEHPADSATPIDGHTTPVDAAVDAKMIDAAMPDAAVDAAIDAAPTIDAAPAIDAAVPDDV